MPLLNRSEYRLRQLRESLRATLSPAQRAWVDSILTPAERVLFYRMPKFDQTHAAAVAVELRDAGEDGLLVRAALLHDVGKTVPPHGIPLLYRGGVVLLGALSPWALRRLALPWGPLWPIYLHVHHPRLGAQALARAGSPDELVRLVRAHQEPAGDERMRRLQVADARH